jgi:hypothetical protein
MITIVNPGTGPVVYDGEGHSVGGGERCEVAELHSAAEQAIAAGHLFIESKAESGGKAGEAKPDPPARRGEKS